MSITDETHTLRQELAALAAKPGWGFLARYDLPGKKPSTLQGRTFRLVRALLTKIRLLPPDITKYRWLPTLKHGSSVPDVGWCTRCTLRPPTFLPACLPAA